MPCTLALHQDWAAERARAFGVTIALWAVTHTHRLSTRTQKENHTESTCWLFSLFVIFGVICSSKCQNPKPTQDLPICLRYPHERQLCLLLPPALQIHLFPSPALNTHRARQVDVSTAAALVLTVSTSQEGHTTEAPAQAFAAWPGTSKKKIYLVSLKTKWQLRKPGGLEFTTWQVASARQFGSKQVRKAWSNHLNAAITQLLIFQVSFLRRNWKQSSTTEKWMEIIMMAQKQKQKSFYVPPFNKRKSNFETAASLTGAHAPRQGLGLVLFLFISQFPCLFSFFPLPVAARAMQGKRLYPKSTSSLRPRQPLHAALRNR